MHVNILMFSVAEFYYGVTGVNEKTSLNLDTICKNN